MTDEELAQIKARRNDSLVLPPGMSEDSLRRIHEAWHDRSVLLADVERLRELVRIVAESDVSMWDRGDDSLIDVGYQTATETIAKARALLGLA